MRYIIGTALTFIVAMGAIQPAKAASVYLALGDSITFGETELQDIPSFA